MTSGCICILGNNNKMEQVSCWKTHYCSTPNTICNDKMKRDQIFLTHWNIYNFVKAKLDADEMGKDIFLLLLFLQCPLQVNI
jgi:hypothetical protein